MKVLPTTFLSNNPMKIHRKLLSVLLAMCGSLPCMAGSDYTQSAEYIALRDSVYHSFNSGNTARFNEAIVKLEDYLLQQNDLHAYYTQRCNEIVFLMNRQNVFEAYKLARQLSAELRQKGLKKEMYMAYNMMGHIYSFCGNYDSARQCFRQVIGLMKKYGFEESLPAIYMNLVNVEMHDNPQTALLLVDTALAVASKYSKDRTFDIETRRTLIYYSLGDTAHFLDGYDHYLDGVGQGLSSVHGRSLEVYHQVILGRYDEAVRLAEEYGISESDDMLTDIYRASGQWKKAYEALKEQYSANDSLNSVILSNSMRDIQTELRIYDADRRASRNKIVALSAAILLLVLIAVALVYIVLSRRRYMRQLRRAYERAMESDNLKTAFIHNITHEVRTPLNIISGFAQVISDPKLDAGVAERQDMAKMMLKNTNLITMLIDEMLELSVTEVEKDSAKTEDNVLINVLLAKLVSDNSEGISSEVSMSLDSQLPDNYTFTTNKMMLKRIVNVLLNNAVKNTAKGTIVLRAEATDSLLTLMVEDTGCGIPAEQAEHIFERFVKLDSFKQGLGLGLTLCRLMSHKLGGSVMLDTSYTAGARFVVTLPVQPA